MNEAKLLLSQLKILCNIGKGHVNLINLLAACTVNLAHSKLLLIVEYCDYGNLKEFLTRNRDYFVDQIVPETGQLDFTILSRPDKDEDEESSDENTVVEIVKPHGDVIDHPDGIRMEAVQPEGMDITTSDLICFVYQVSRGMHYLSCNNVIHRYLSARNVCLAHGNIVKIGGFGIAKDDEEYRTRSDRPLPVKWRAIETLKHQTFNSKTDVWAFAVTCWEVFSLGATPYPGIRVDQDFIDFLEAGGRMRKPDYCPIKVWDSIVTQCWLHDPEQRPCFDSISNRLANLLEDKVRDRCLKLERSYERRGNTSDDSIKQANETAISPTF